MKKIFYLSVMIFTSFFLLFSMFLDVAHAAPVYPNKARLVSGVGNYGKSTQYYWISSSGATTTWINNANTAVSKWTNSNGTGAYTPISFRKTSNQKSSVSDAYYKNYGNNGWFGLVEYFNGNTMIAASGKVPTKNYFWTKVKMNTYKFFSNKSLYHNGVINGKVIGEVSEQIFSHEFGHVLGLAHFSDTNANAGKVLMRNSFPRATGPTKDELNTITSLYK